MVVGRTMEKPPIEEKTREEVEAERKAKRAAKQERKKAALNKQNADGSEAKPKNQPSEPPKVPKASEPAKESKPKAVSTLDMGMGTISSSLQCSSISYLNKQPFIRLTNITNFTDSISSWEQS